MLWKLTFERGHIRCWRRVLEEEVNAFLGRHRYDRSRLFRGYRNGYHQTRELTVGLAAVAVCR